MKKGFTLVEMSIVLVIIGLLIGGVLAGQELVKQSINTKAIRDLEGYKTAVVSFKLKYDGLPGDLKNATNFWGEVSPGCTEQLGTGTQTCDGNGNDKISEWGYTTTYYEFMRFWQHLSNSGLINGSYNGAGLVFTAGLTSPAGAHKKSTIGILNESDAAKIVWSIGGFASTYNHFFIYGMENTLGHPWDAVMTTEDAAAIDKKVDDGSPGNGIWQVLPVGNTWDSSACTTTSVRTTAIYDLTKTSIECMFLVKLGF